MNPHAVFTVAAPPSHRPARHRLPPVPHRHHVGVIGLAVAGLGALAAATVVVAAGPDPAPRVGPASSAPHVVVDPDAARCAQTLTFYEPGAAVCRTGPVTP